VAFLYPSVFPADPQFFGAGAPKKAKKKTTRWVVFFLGCPNKIKPFFA
jgi:hypothetical protein